MTSCMCFFLKPASNSEEMVSSVNWWLGGVVRLMIVPALWIALPEAFIRPFYGGQLSNSFMDHANNLNYIFTFLFGFAITAADGHGMKEVLRRGRWIYFVIGFILSIIHSLGFLLPSSLPLSIGKGFLRAGAQWIFIL